MKLFVLLAGFLLSAAVQAQDEDSRVVLGPQNPDLHAGAEAIRSGNARRGVELTLSGLAMATSRRERVIGFNNLCAAYSLLSDYPSAVEACNEALQINAYHWRSYSNRAIALIKLERYDEARADVRRAMELSPGAERPKEVLALLRDATDPVAPSITVDDRAASEREPDNDR
ncbi:MAG: tetratricopeptide repeat protein [Pseudomonadota bacterium]